MKKISYLLKMVVSGIFALFVLSVAFEGCSADRSENLKRALGIDKEEDLFNHSFISVWKADDSKKITIPLNGKYKYNYSISWRKENNPEIGGSKLNIISNDDYTFSVPTAGKYIVSIIGTFPAIYFGENKEGVNRESLLDVKQWGNIEWQSMESAFYGCKNLRITANDQPNLSKVTSMEAMFRGASFFNQPIEKWDVSNVTNMKDMFLGATNFDQPIGKWNVGNVTSMKRMFRDASNFNQPIGNWNVRNVTDMKGMFKAAYKFNQPIGKWSVGNVTDMSGMFYNTTEFNQPIGDWDVRSVTNMEWMFSHSRKFNQPIGNWDLEHITNLRYIFALSEAFDQNIKHWKVKGADIKCLAFHSVFSASEFWDVLHHWEENGINEYPETLDCEYEWKDESNIVQ